MATNRITSTLAGAAAALVLLAAAPAHGDELPASASLSAPGRNELEIDLERRLHRVLAGRSTAIAATPQSSSASTPPSRHSYSWPVKPFHAQHPVRGFFGDPRIGMTPKGMHSSFHFGIDVSVPDGAPVYATLSGTVQRWSHRPEVVGVRGDDGRRSFEYWHILPAVSAGERVTAYRTIVGYVEEGWGHVHFSELRDGVYLNPLRVGALGPFEDTTRPTVKSLRAERGETGVKLHGLSGTVDLVSEAFDETPLAVPAPWAGRPVTPALVRWRVRGDAWKIAVDVRRGVPTDDRYGAVYALWTRQNKPWSNGRYRFYLAHGWDTTALSDGTYVIDVAASDTRGNTTVRSFPIRVRNGA
jgi:hypothetical protein